MYKMIAIDLDDTLLNHEGEVSGENLKAIEEAREEGVQIVLCSGRPSRGMHHVIESMGLNKEGEYYISFNGGIIRNCHDHQIIFEKGMSLEIGNWIIDLAREFNLNAQMYIEDEVLVEKYEEATKDYEIMNKLRVKVVDDLKQHNKGNIIKMLINDDPKRLKGVYTEIQKRSSQYKDFMNKVNIFFSRDYLLEFISNETNKGIAAMELAKILGIKNEEVIAIGDSYNDLYMIEMAGLGVLVANGREDLKDKADYVTTNKHDEDAVKEVIYKFVIQ